MSNTWHKRERKRTVTLRMGENKKKIDFEIMKKERRRSMRNVKAIPMKFQHALVIADIDKKKISKVVKKTRAWRIKISLLKDVKIRKRFEENVINLVDVVAQNLWGHLKDGGIQACVVVCG